MIVKFHFIKVKLSFVLVCCYGFWYSLFYNLLYCLGCLSFLSCFVVLIYIVVFYKVMAIPSQVLSLMIICIIGWVGRQERRDSLRLTIYIHTYKVCIYIYMHTTKYTYIVLQYTIYTIYTIYIYIILIVQSNVKTS